ncbi:MAG: hypothetical protein UY48_C0005G0014 [Candidatus Gottesmanbacteria bacterium GW2011_GWB1_49_7]|uniref:Uncharacterized protein n=1 Tax=Candidatus Gottesmanbacteria bacterium GW2011_GWB1_49_7 TaxID=1618448 RepID=A0A0G1W2V6_9BACT|nr:MAG: hypothetical protein UY48_C0005G0014 [Candidatus Gottesmanbacteria bacterium GW2011_GWB1_49_7]
MGLPLGPTPGDEAEYVESSVWDRILTHIKEGRNKCLSK